jgi:antitoxin (DNA-binding transcriptional repressor) of toxin-antitoxin stability system
MKTVSMLELRSKGREVVKRLDRGERLELTYRGRKVATMEPALLKKSARVPDDDPIRTFHKLAEPLGPMSNEDIDQLLYGEGSRFS